jgi:PAS domain S-box-containing protein
MKTTLRYKLLAWFLLFAFLIVVFIFPINYLHNSKHRSIFETQQRINKLHLHLANDLKSTSNFFAYETVNPLFYITGESNYLDEHNFHAKAVDSLIGVLMQANNSARFPDKKQVRSIQQNYQSFQRNFDSIVVFTYYKGFKNFGLEGEMLEYISELEEIYHLNPNDLLRLRTNEKNYLLRRREVYAENLNIACNAITTKYQKQKSIPGVENITKLIANYKESFNELVEYDRKIGLLDNRGLKQKTLEITNVLDAQLEELSASTNQHYNATLSSLKLYYFLFIGLVLLLTLGVSFMLSKKLAAPLHALSDYIKELARSNFHYPPDENLTKASFEVSHIYNEFRNLVTQLYIRESQRDKARQRSRENELKFRELAEMLPQSIFESDHLGNYTYVNKEWHNIFGYSTADLNDGLNLIETLVSDTGIRIMDEKEMVNTDFIALRKDGTYFPAAIYTRNIIKNNAIVGKRGLIVDVTDRNKYIESLKHEKQKAQHSDKLKSSFLANMSHEIRTPMNTIIGFSDLLDADELSQEQKRDFVNHIRSSGEMLLHLIDDIIDIAKIEAGEIKIEKADTNITNLFDELKKVFEGYKRQLQKNDIELVVTVPDIELTVKADKFRLRQVLYNLISNAIKFTDKGKVEFGYRILQDKQIEFFVNDTGIGLSSDKLDLIFKRFQQIDKIDAKKLKGSGLGLAIAKNLVELMGGAMWVESEQGQGTSFTFTHPLIRLRGIKTIEPPTKSETDILRQYNWSDKTILVAEDDDVNYTFLKEALRKTNAKLIRANNGKETVELALQSKIDLVLMDVQMPEMNGYDATKLIKAKKKTLPIIAQTAHAMADEKEQSVLAGCDDYIAKPIRLDILFPKMNQFLASKSAVSKLGKSSTAKSNDTVSNLTK